MQTTTTDDARRSRYWKTRIFVFAWIGYALFYLCRANFSIAIPGILDDLGVSKTTLGLVGSALFFAYAIGQVINGQLGDYFGARRIVTVGIVASAVANALFGFTGTIIQMTLVWGLNGYFQSMGFSPNVKLLGDWFRDDRGKILGLYGSCYQVGNALSWVLAGYLATIGWRYVFWVPSLIFGLSSILYYAAIRDNPRNLRAPTPRIGVRNTLRSTLTNTAIWLVALAFFFVDIVRYGFFVWAATYLVEIQGASITSAALKVAIIPITGSLGAITSGWLSQKIGDRRALIASVLMFVLAGVAYLFPGLPVDLAVSLASFAVIGFCTYGAHVLMVAAMPVDFSNEGASASACGFIDGFGYLGATLVSVISGILIDLYGWAAAFNFWVVSAVLAGLVLVPLYNKRPVK